MWLKKVAAVCRRKKGPNDTSSQLYTDFLCLLADSLGVEDTHLQVSS
jgi:hypothetical protein